jgi:ubiquinone/menaquinone biosynthesis C-methylase UbiE
MNNSFGTIFKRAVGRGVYPHQMAWALELGVRNVLMSPKKHLKRLPLRSHFHAVEIGCGSGFYSVAVARALSYGALTLIDIQEEMLAKTRSKMDKAHVENVRYIAADAAKLPFGDETVDMIYLVTVFGELHDQQAFLREAKRVLKMGGFLSITEHQPDPDFTAMDSVEPLVVGEGFTILEMYGWQWNYTLNFKKITA